MYPEGPTDKAQIDSTKYNSKLLGENDKGNVYIHAPLGNIESEIKIAYLIGMHPLESKSHRALFEKLNSNKNLKYTYYIYNINVKDKNSQSEGRLEGQLLAQEFVAPDIINQKYDLFIDIHSNRGSMGPGDYKITNFVFAPGFDDKSSKYMNNILNEFNEIVYYAPEFRSSPPFITEPTSKAGIPTIVYECYSYEPMNTTYDLAEKLINIVDDLKF
ncbi:MAG: adhesin [Methanobrevibacter thaueri]|nr:adhesin [Methanobrevibacter thaueri]